MDRTLRQNRRQLIKDKTFACGACGTYKKIYENCKKCRLDKLYKSLSRKNHLKDFIDKFDPSEHHLFVRLYFREHFMTFFCAQGYTRQPLKNRVVDHISCVAVECDNILAIRHSLSNWAFTATQAEILIERLLIGRYATSHPSDRWMIYHELGAFTIDPWNFKGTTGTNLHRCYYQQAAQLLDAPTSKDDYFYIWRQMNSKQPDYCF